MADVLDQSQTNSGNLNTIRFNATTNVKVGQSFVPSVTAELSKMTFKNKRIGSPSGSVWAELYDDNGSGLPNTQLATSDTRNVTTISTSETDYDWVFSGANRVELSSGTKYHVVMSGDWSFSTSNGIQIATTSASDDYASGDHIYYTTSWNAYTPDDMYFKSYYDDTTLSGGEALNILQYGSGTGVRIV